MDPALLHELRARFGRLGAVQRWGGSQGAVWRVEVPGGAVVVKVAGVREREALRRVQGLRPDVPEIVAELEGAIVLGWIAGRVAKEEEHVHARAGVLLRRIHELPVDDRDPISIPEALAIRVQRWCARARGRVGDEIVDRVRDRVRPEAFAGERRALCHRDFTPENWIVRDDGSVAVIDFGHARLDLPLWDFVKLAADAWVRKPELRARFLAGYGAAEDPRVAQLVALHGLQTLCWGLEHGDAHFVALGRRVLDSVR